MNKKNKILAFVITLLVCLVLSNDIVYANIKGDLDGDGEVTSYDAFLCLELQEKNVTKEELEIADIDGDNIITELDVNLIFEYSVEIVEDETMWTQPEPEPDRINDFYYNQLNSDEKTVYNGLVEAQEKANRDGVITDCGIVFEDYYYFDKDERLEQYKNALMAYQYDNPETISVYGTSFSAYKTEENDEVAFGGKVTTYLDKNMKNVDIAEAKQEVEVAKDKAISGIANKSDYEKIKYLHDYLIKNNEYDKSLGDAAGSYNVYGALVKGCSVCEGYARAYKYLLNSVGVECEIIVSATHAWNAVKLENKWYYVDCTWDDLGGTKVGYDYFLKGVSMENVRAHTLEKVQRLVYPNMSKTDYKKK